MNVFEKRNSVLATEFDRYVREHPEFAARIPQNAQIVLQVEGDPEYNHWIEKVAEDQREEGQPVVYALLNGLEPVHSRLIKPVLQKGTVRK